jgi:V/A-type H+-transporting ATPase subunit E
MSLSNLLAGLEAEAATDAARLEAETREEANRIVEAAGAEARRLRERATSAGEDELQREAEQRRARARLEAAAVVREAHEEAFREFLADVRSQLDALRERADYPAVMRALLVESMTAVPAATTLRVDPRDERLAVDLRGELGAELDLDTELATAGGVELAGDDGRTVRNTIEERLANAEPALRLLFGEALRR